MAAGDYVLAEFPDDATLEREARVCPLLAYCPERTFSFCLVPSRFLRTFRQPHRPVLRHGYSSSSVTSR